MLETILEIATEAGELARTYFEQQQNVTIKDDGSQVTEADLRVNDFIESRLTHHFPSIPVLTEEGAAAIPDAETYWIVDPIDGTSNFIDRNPYFSISIALWDKTDIVLGVVHMPMDGTMYAAIKGGGAWRNQTPIQIRACNTLEEADLLLDIGRRQRTRTFHQSLRERIPSYRSIEPRECASLELCEVASGMRDAMIHRGLAAWDIAAGMLIASEAGALVSNLYGNPKDLFSSGIIACHPALMHELSSITTTLLDEEGISA